MQISSSKKKNFKIKLKSRKHKNRLKVLDVFKLSLFRLLNLTKRSTFENRCTIRLTANNMFCTFSKILNNQIIQCASSGMYKIKTTKKRMKYTYKTILDTFLNKSTQLVQQKNKNLNLYRPLILIITAKKRFHKRVIKNFYKISKRKILFLTIIKPKRCFNGCRASKKRRKKRLRYRIFK